MKQPSIWFGHASYVPHESLHKLAVSIINVFGISCELFYYLCTLTYSCVQEFWRGQIISPEIRRGLDIYASIAVFIMAIGNTSRWSFISQAGVLRALFIGSGHSVAGVSDTGI